MNLKQFVGGKGGTKKGATRAARAAGVPKGAIASAAMSRKAPKGKGPTRLAAIPKKGPKRVTKIPKKK